MGNFAFLANPKPLYVGIAVALALLVSLLSIILSSRALGGARRLKRRYTRMMTGDSGADLEQMLLKHSQQVNAALAQLREIQDQIGNHEQRLRNKTNTPKVLRYNAFGEQGNDLSFTFALVDEEGNGAVLSSIYGREESRVYAKPVEASDSGYTLTDEERSVILGIEVDTIKEKRKRVKS